MMNDIPLAEIQDLRVVYGARNKTLQAVDGVSFAIRPGRSVGLVGESGSGKSTLGRALLRLEKIQSGRLLFEGRDLLALKGRGLKAFRRKAQMIFQDPAGSLNPRLSVGGALREVLFVHRVGDRLARRQRVAELLELVGLNPDCASRYPHEFSGGQRQRIGIARALALEPKLIVADEPVSALDVSVQVQILNLLRDIQKRMGLSYLFIAHDLAVVRYVCDEVLVMYKGRIVEQAAAERLYADPRHPYTRLLLASVPDVWKGLKSRSAAGGRDAHDHENTTDKAAAAGCAFHPRCPWAIGRCRVESPALKEYARGHQTACHRSADLKEP
ncbi:MAG: ABC transporter ATP-binding protein [Lentisphaerota bacterium]